MVQSFTVAIVGMAPANTASAKREKDLHLKRPRIFHQKHMKWKFFFFLSKYKRILKYWHETIPCIINMLNMEIRPKEKKKIISNKLSPFEWNGLIFLFFLIKMLVEHVCRCVKEKWLTWFCIVCYPLNNLLKGDVAELPDNIQLMRNILVSLVTHTR